MLVLEMHDKIKASSLCERNKPFAQCVTIHQFKPSWQEWGDIWIFAYLRRKIGSGDDHAF